MSGAMKVIPGELIVGCSCRSKGGRCPRLAVRETLGKGKARGLYLCLPRARGEECAALHDEGEVLIRYGAVAFGPGWAPYVEEGGRRIGNTWWSKAWDKEAALAEAETQARARAARYVGDWRVTVEATT